MMNSDETKRQRRRKRNHGLKPSERTTETQESLQPRVTATDRVSHKNGPSNEKNEGGIPITGIEFRSNDEETGNQEVRRSLPKNIANEIKQSFIIRRTKKLRERRNLIAQVRERRELKQKVRQIASKAHDEMETTKPNGTFRTNEDLNDYNALTTQRTIHQEKINNSSPETNVDEMNRQQQKRMESKSNLIQSVTITPSTKTNLEKISGRQRKLGESTSNSDTRDNPNDSFSVYKMECTRLKAEKKSLKAKLVARGAQTSLLGQQVNDLTSETQHLRKQLSEYQAKSNKLCEMHSKERIKFDNSTELIAQAKIGLTKALNDASNLEAKIDDLDTIVDDRERRIDDLYETIEQQTQKIGEINMKLKDKDTLLRLTENEKRILEDEVEVLMASKDERETGETLRRLERAREKWLQDREAKIEAARMQLENENDKHLEREKNRHRQEHGVLIEHSNKKKQTEERQQKMQDFVNQQLDDMMDINRELQTKLTKERERLISERKEQDNTIQSLELLVIDLRNQLATRNRSQKELKFQKSLVKSMREELRDARNQKKLLTAKLSDLDIRYEESVSVHKNKEKPLKKSRKKSKKSNETLLASNKEIGELKAKQKTKKKVLDSPLLSDKKGKRKKKKSVGKKSTATAFKKTTSKQKRKKQSKYMEISKAHSEDSLNSLAVHKYANHRIKKDGTISINTKIPSSIVLTPGQ